MGDAAQTIRVSLMTPGDDSPSDKRNGLAQASVKTLDFNSQTLALR
jgi:hypothetical protein